jgi:hypothetical protein
MSAAAARPGAERARAAPRPPALARSPPRARSLACSLACSLAQVATCLLDGFPRSPDNLRLFDEQVGKPHAVLVLHAPDDVARERAARLDSSKEDAAAFGKRLESYAKRTLPMVEQLETAGLDVRRIDAHGSDAHVFARMVAALGWPLPAGMEAAPPSAAAVAPAASAPRPTPPTVSLEPADDTPLKSVTGAKYGAGGAAKHVEGTAAAGRKAVVLLGANEAALAAALAALVADQGYTEIGLKQAIEAGVASGADGAASLAADLEAGKLIAAERACGLLDAAMAGAGPYAIRATGAGAALVALLGSSVRAAPPARGRRASERAPRGGPRARAPRAARRAARAHNRAPARPTRPPRPLRARHRRRRPDWRRSRSALARPPTARPSSPPRAAQPGASSSPSARPTRPRRSPRRSRRSAARSRRTRSSSCSAGRAAGRARSARCSSSTLATPTSRRAICCATRSRPARRPASRSAR